MELPEDLQKPNIMSLNLRLIQACGYLREDTVNTSWIVKYSTGIIKYLILLLFISFLVGACDEIYQLRDTPHDLGEAIVFVITITKSSMKIVSLIQYRNE